MSDPYAAAREAMVREQIEARGVRDPGVLDACRAVPRHRFVRPAQWPQAYEDHPLAIGLESAISQPFITAYMAEALEPAGERVLEVGTGSGYETALLARLAKEVYTIEIDAEHSRRAAGVLAEVGASNVRLRVGDGLQGWAEAAPFPRIILTAAVESTPQALLDQLAVGGRFIGPIGKAREQRLMKIVRTPEGFDAAELMPVVFVQAHGVRP